MTIVKVLTPKLEIFKRDIVDENNLEDFFLIIKQLTPVIVVLHFQTLGFLTIGISEKHGFVEYMKETKDPPYLIALEGEKRSEENKFIEFNIDGVATPIQFKNCIHPERVYEIVKYFYKFNKLPDNFEWQELQ
jgi:hypothetical protein